MNGIYLTILIQILKLYPLFCAILLILILPPSNQFSGFFKLLAAFCFLLVWNPAMSQNDVVEDSYDIVVQSYINKGDSQLDVGPQNALVFYQQALTYAQKHNDTFNLANCYSKLGKAYYHTGQYYSSLYYHQKALNLLEHSVYDSLRAAELSEIGSVYYFSDMGDLGQAMAYFQASYDEFAGLGLLEPAGLNLNYSAYVHWAKGEKETALEIHRQALQTFKRAKNKKGIATSLSDIGFTLNSLQDYVGGLDASKSAYKLEVELNDAIMQVPTLGNIGISYLGLNQLDSALKYAHKSLEMAQAMKLTLRQNEATKTLVDIYEAKGDFKNALEYHREHKALNDSLKNSDQAKRLIALKLTREFEEKQNLQTIQEEKEHLIINAQLSQRKYIIIGLIIILSFGIALLTIVYFNGRNQRKLNLILNENKKELIQKNNELTRLLKELKDTNAQLIQAEKMATLGILTAGVAHEINNPLNFIQGGIYSIETCLEENEIPNKEEFRSVIDQMQNGVDRAAEIVKSLGRFSRKETVTEFKPLDIVSVIDSCLLMLNHRLKYKCVVNKNFDESTRMLVSNENALQHILMNLISNASDAIKDEGVIDITTFREGSATVISIKDSGKGMTSEVLNHIFDPFFTTKPAGQGTGLGMSITYKLAKSINADIRYESEIDRGTTVYLKLNPIQ